MLTESDAFGHGSGVVFQFAVVVVVFLVLPDLTYLQFSAMDALAGMMMKGAAKCDKHAE